MALGISALAGRTASVGGVLAGRRQRAFRPEERQDNPDRQPAPSSGQPQTPPVPTTPVPDPAPTPAAQGGGIAPTSDETRWRGRDRGEGNGGGASFDIGSMLGGLIRPRNNQQTAPAPTTGGPGSTTPAAPTTTAPTAPPVSATPAPAQQGIAPRALLDDSVSNRVTGLIDQNSDLMRQAAQNGMAIANRRGLINSSIAAGAAQGEVLRTAIPIASQDAAQAAARNLQSLDAGDQMARLQRQIDSAEGQQKLDLQSQMERLKAAATFDQERVKLQGTIDKALQASGAQQQQELAKAQGEIAKALQAQTDAATLERLNTQFVQNTEAAAKANEYTLQQIAAQGTIAMQETLAKAQASLQELQISIAANNKAKVAELTTQIFAYESQLRAALLSNTEMPASERAAYEKAISSLGDPARAYVNGLYAAPVTGGIAPPGVQL